MPTLSASAVLKDSSGNLLSGENVSFTYAVKMADGSIGPATSMPSGVTDATGTAVSSATVPSLTAGEEYDVHASFAGTSQYLPSSGDGFTSLTPCDQTTFQNISVSPPSPQLGEAVTIAGTLEDTTAAVALPNEPFSAQVDGNAPQQFTTDSSGNFSFQISNLSLGKHVVSLSFAGASPTLCPSISSMTIQVGTLPTPSTASVGVAAVVLIAAAAGAYVIAKKRKRT